MKHLLILTIEICLLISVPAIADQAADEAAIRKVLEKIIDTYNSKDLAAHMPLLHDDFVTNVNKKGKAAQKEYLEKLFSSEEYTQVKLGDAIDITFLTPVVAIYRTHGEDLKPPKQWISAWVFKKNSGNWVLSADFWWFEE